MFLFTLKAFSINGKAYYLSTVIANPNCGKGNTVYGKKSYGRGKARTFGRGKQGHFHIITSQ